MGWVGFESCRIQSLERSTSARGLPLLICIRPAAPDFCLWHGVRPRGRQAHVWRISFQFSHSQSLVRGGGNKTLPPPSPQSKPCNPPLRQCLLLLLEQDYPTGCVPPLIVLLATVCNCSWNKRAKQKPSRDGTFRSSVWGSPPPQPFISIAFCFLSRVGNLLIHSFIQNRSF